MLVVSHRGRPLGPLAARASPPSKQGDSMLVEAIFLAILVGLIRGGKVKNLDLIPLKYLYVFAIAVCIYAFTEFTGARSGRADMVHVARLANLVQYVVLLVAIGLNLRSIPEMWIVAAGTLCNFLAVATNGGVMPISPIAASAAGIPEILAVAKVRHMVRHVSMSPLSHFKPLSDIIPIGPFPFLPHGVALAFEKVASVGDIIVALAVFILIHRYMMLKVNCGEKSA